VPLKAPCALDNLRSTDNRDSNCPYAKDPQSLVKWGVGFRFKASKPARVWEVVLSTLGSLYNLDWGLLSSLSNLFEKDIWIDYIKSIKCLYCPWDIIYAISGLLCLSFNLVILNCRS
jgi:hypothetical protein